MKKRIDFIDSLKGFAIFIVIWGHSIQYLKGNEFDFFQDPIFAFIYSFHMPLFFFLSGFFFQSSLKLTFKNFTLKKIEQLLLPCFIWAILYVLYGVFIKIAMNKPLLWDEVLISIVNPFEWSLWFLRELFICFLLAFIFIKAIKIEWLAAVASIVFVLITPIGAYSRTFLPIFWVGFFFHKESVNIFRHTNLYLILSGIIFFICLLFWNGNYTIYVTDSPMLFNLITHTFNFENINIIIFRFLIGLAGSVFFFLLIKKTYRKNSFFSLFERAGVLTLGIYILQNGIIVSRINELLDFSPINSWTYSLILTPAISLIVIILCVLTIKIINRNRKISLLLLGSSYLK